MKRVSFFTIRRCIPCSNTKLFSEKQKITISNFQGGIILVLVFVNFPRKTKKIVIGFLIDTSGCTKW